MPTLPHALLYRGGFGITCALFLVFICLFVLLLFVDWLLFSGVCIYMYAYVYKCV